MLTDTDVPSGHNDGRQAQPAQHNHLQMPTLTGAAELWDIDAEALEGVQFQFGTITSHWNSTAADPPLDTTRTEAAP